MSAPEFPEAMPPVDLKNILQPLSLWAAKTSAEADLESIFGPRLDWATAFKHLAAFRRADFSFLPAIHTLLAAEMPGLWGGYSRDTQEIYLSADCPEESLSAVLIEEIGHFLDQELCLEETPGEEGALFAATVLGLPISNSQREAFSSDNDLLEVSRNGQPLLVEGAKSSGGKKSGSGRRSGGRRRGGRSKSVFSNSEVSASGGGGGGGGGGGTPSASPSNVPPSSGSSSLGGGSVVLPPSQDGNLRIEQKRAGDTLVGSQGNDTFVIFDQNVTIDDSYGGTDAVESKVSFSLANISTIENLFLTGVSNTDGTGNARANLISGNSGNNKLDGGAGADTLQAGAGNDTLLGGEGSDLLEGGEGADLVDGGLGTDTMSGGAGNDTYYVGSASEFVIEAAGGGTDTIITSDRSITLATYANIENIVYVGTLDGGGGSELVSTLGTENDDYLFGGAGNDSLLGRGGNDTLEGKSGNDFLDGGSGSDTMSGGAGNDTYVLDATTDVIQENPNAGTDVIISSVSYVLGNNLENLTLNPSLAVADANINGTGNSLANIITGNAGNNQLDGGGGADTLTAGAGNDILNGGTADDVGDLLQGGEGNDRYIVTDSTPDVIRDSGGTDTVETTVSFDIGDTLSVEGIEHLLYKDNNAAATLKGNNADNSLTSKGTSADSLEGGAGNDTLDGGTGANTLIGGTGDDYYIVNSSLESGRIFEETNGGLDTVLTKVATFSLGADPNVEILIYDPLGTSKTNLTGSNSDNTIIGGNFGNTLYGDTDVPSPTLWGNDYLIGGVQGDTLIGGAGNDTLDGKAGVNSLVGGAGDDYYFTDSQSVNILEDTVASGGKDTVRSSVAFNLSFSNKLAGIEGLYLTGSASLAGTGNSLDNTITGNDGNNVLDGKAGDDTILGGLGADYIKGDEGNDSIVGGGDIQGDVPADASTPILLASGQTYTGQINSRNETDWIRVDLQVGVTYSFNIDSQLVGGKDPKNPLSKDSVLAERSDVAFGAQGSDQYWPMWQDGNIGYQPPLVGDKDNQTQGGPWIGILTDHDELVLKADGTVAYGYFDPKQITKSTKYSNNIVGFQFTPFESGTFYVPVSGAGPALGSYRVTLTDPDNLSSGTPALADNASNTLIGGQGRDTLVAGNGRDAQGNAIGDILLGGTNGLVGSVDTDNTLLDGADDTLIGGDGNDSLDGGNGANSLIGGKGNDYYYIRSASDVVVEKTDGGTGDAMIVNFAAKLGGHWDIVLDPDYDYLKDELSRIRKLLGKNEEDDINGSSDNETLSGSAISDLINGEAGNDSLESGAGNDVLVGGGGVNTLIGGVGDDTYFVENILDVVRESDGEGTDTIVTSNRNITFLTYANIERIIYSPFQFANIENVTLTGSANTSVLGSPNSDKIVGNFGNNTFDGGVGDDTLLGMGGNDYLIGGEGSDSLDGGSGISTMDGGSGYDTYVINDRNDRIINEEAGLDGGEDVVFTGFNFDPILSDAVSGFVPDVADNSPSITKSQSFASKDLSSFYNLEHFVLTGAAAYGVGNALANSMTAASSSALLLGMGGEDTLLGGAGDDSLFGDTPDFYASPDIYAAAPKDTRTKAFIDGVIGSSASDYLNGGDGNNYLDGGRGFDTMIGGKGNDTIVQDNVDDYIVAGGGIGIDELISSVNVNKAADGISKLTLVVAKQAEGSGQSQVASFGSFLGTESANNLSQSLEFGGLNFKVENSNFLQVMYAPREGQVFENENLIVGDQEDDLKNPGKFQYDLSWTAGANAATNVVGYTVRYSKFTQAINGDLLVSRDSKNNSPGNISLILEQSDSIDSTFKSTIAFNPESKVTEITISFQAGASYSGLSDFLNQDLATKDLINARLSGDGAALLSSELIEVSETWHTYVKGGSQDFQGTASNPTLKITNLEEGAYDFEVVAFERTLAAHNGAAQYVTLQGGSGSDVLSGRRLTSSLNGGLADDEFTDPLVLNNPIDPLPAGFIFNAGPYYNSTLPSNDFATYIDGGLGNDLLYGARVNDQSGDAYTLQEIEFKGLNTLVGGQGSDTFAVLNGGTAIGDEFDWVVKYGNETPVTTETGVGASLNGGQHNLVVSRVDYLVLSDTLVHQGKFIDQLALADFGQFGMGNRLDNYIYDGAWIPSAENTLVGNTGRDSIIANSSLDVLIGGTAYGTDNVGLAIADFVGVNIGGNGLTNSIFRDTDPVPVSLGGPAVADPSQFWFVPGYYGGVYDPNRNQDTLAASDKGKFETGLTLDGGAGRDSLVGTDTEIEKIGDMFIVSQGEGGKNSQDTLYGDAVIGNGGNDTVTFTDSDYLWWSGHQEGAVLQKNTYTLGEDISNLILGQGAVSARNGSGNRTSTGYEDALGSNLIIGNEFANILDGDGVGGKDETGSGIDTLTGGSGDDLFVVSGYTESTGNKWDVSVLTTITTTTYASGIPDLIVRTFSHIPLESIYTDSDYVLISDFEVSDSIQLSSFLQDYWIGAAPSKSGLVEDNVRPGSAGLTEFGLYKAPTDPKEGPNLVAHIRLKGWSLAPADLSPSNYAFPPNFGPRSVSELYLGWGEFYSLAGSSFAPNVDQGQYVQKDSYASLVQIFLAGDNTFQGGSTDDTYNGYDANDSLKGGGGNDTLFGGEGQDLLLGEDGADSLLGEVGFDTIFGGDGDDTLDGGAGGDTILGEAGNDSLFGGSGDDSLDGGLGLDTLRGGDGNDTLVWRSGSTIDGGNGSNSLQFLDVARLNDEDWGAVSNIGKLLLTDASDSISLGINFQNNNITRLINAGGGNDTLDAFGVSAEVTLSGDSGNDSILGGSVGDSLLGGSGNDYVDGKAGNDTLQGGDNNDTLLGGAGNDTILGDAGNDSILGGANDDSLVAGSGSDTLLGWDGNDKLVLSSSGNSTLLGESGDDRFQFASASELNASSIVGGSGKDSLEMTKASFLSDDDFDAVSQVEVVDASSLTDSISVTLGRNAWSAGITSLFGGEASDYLSASGFTSGVIYIKGGTSGSKGDTLVAGSGASRSTLEGNNVEGAVNDFYIQEASLLGNNTITGGAASTDNLRFNNVGTLTDTSFANVSHLDKIYYNNLGQNYLNLGANAEGAFDGDTIFVEANTSSGISDIIDLSEVKTKKVYFDAFTESGGIRITAGANANTIIGGQAIGADDLFIFKTAESLRDSSIMGGGGTDTLRLSGNSQDLPSDTLSGISGIEILDIAGAGNNITLSGDLGITTIYGGTGPNTIDASNYSSAPNVLTWNMNASDGSDNLLGGTAGNLFQIKNGANLQNSFITGNAGLDTIQLLAGAQTLGDSAFTNSSSIEKFILGSATNGNSITLGATAASKGIATVIGGTSKDTIDASAFGQEIWIDASAGTGARLIGSTTAPLGNTLIGGSAGGNEFILGSLGSNSIVGGSNGLDTLTFNDTTAAVNFASLSKIGTLKFNDAGNTVVLGQDALIAGIRTLVGGEGDDTGGDFFNTSAYGTAGVLFQITDQNYLANITTMVGGTGVDTVKFSRDGVSVTDEVVANLYNIDVLQTANGNNLFVLSDQFVSAGIDSIIGGTGKDTIDISDNSIYTPTPVSDVPGAVSDIITFDASAGTGYTLFGTTNNFPYAKVIGGTAGGAVILDGTSLVDSDFANMFQANAKTLTMRTETGVSVEVGLNAKGSGLTKLNMAGGDDQIDTRAFAGTLTVSGGGGNDLIRTSFAALSDLTFTGATGDDTLQIVGSDARAITALKGDFEALVLNAGNNFVVLGNDASLSTIYGGSGYDTISMLSNTTGIHFVVDADKLGSLSGFNSLNGGSGSDTLGFSSSPTGGSFVDTQFTRIGLRNLTGGSGGEIENLVTYSDPITGFGRSSYTLGSISDNAGISKVFFHEGDTVDASGRQAVTSKAMNFVFTDPTVIGTARILGTGGTDTLTAKSDVATGFTITNTDFQEVLDMEIFVFENSNASSGVNLEIGNWVEVSGITTFIGGTGSDTFDASSGDYEADSSMVGGAGGDSIIGGGGKDVLVGGEGSDNLSGGAEDDSILGTSAAVFGAGEKDTLTGDGGKDTFILGDATNAYYNTNPSAGDFVLITDFTAGDDIIQLKSLAAVNLPTLPAVNAFGYLFGDASPAGDIYKVGTFGAIAVNSYLYADTNKTGLIDAGDNLIAAISSTGGPLSTSVLNDSTMFKFV